MEYLKRTYQYWGILFLFLLLFLFPATLSLYSSIPIEDKKILSARQSLLQPSSHVQPLKNNILYQLYQPLWLNSINMGQILVNITSTSDVFDGYNLFVLEQRNITDPKYKHSLFITDMQGKVMAERVLPSSTHKIASFRAKFINASTILLGQPDNPVLWNIYTNKSVYLGGIVGHHDYEYNPLNKTYFTFGGSPDIIINGTEYSFGSIVELNSSGQIIWSLDTNSFISPNQWCPFQDSKINGTADLVHPNSIFFDVENDVLYFNARNVNTFYKIDHKTGKVLWGLGGHGNFTLFNKNGVQRPNLFYHAHAVEKVDENTFILFDNDLHNQTNPSNRRSRILEISINESTMTANESWSWIAPPNYYSGAYGDADRLPNGNRLGTFGTLWHPDKIRARLAEVNEGGELVWEMNFPQSDFVYNIYRLERFRFSPILDSPSDITTLLEANFSITWQTWYNFRTNIQMLGSYTLYLDNQIIENGTHVFDKFWRPK
ncbi:MAG: aryl-sulfate sulfotransferase, partial [Candidatus Hodarchaeota archaeon]